MMGNYLVVGADSKFDRFLIAKVNRRKTYLVTIGYRELP
jgi:hypothetical protein